MVTQWRTPVVLRNDVRHIFKTGLVDKRHAVELVGGPVAGPGGLCVANVAAAAQQYRDRLALVLGSPSGLIAGAVRTAR